MASRFNTNPNASHLHQRDNARSALFSSYDSQSRPNSRSPAPSRPGAGSAGGGYGYVGAAAEGPHGSGGAFGAYPSSASASAGVNGRPSSGSAAVGFSAYPGSSNANAYLGSTAGAGGGTGGLYGGAGAGEKSEAGFRAATPNSRGQYSDAVLSELESQNDEELEGMSKRVRMLKDISVAIGTEIRSSTALAESMNNSFDSTRTRLKGTMGRMLRMAERTGVGWRVWLGFFLVVGALFWWVWLF
ncbi:hypothetical protein B0A49_04553 [Cryomyces minteri]|uniref:t-SNARE coiled-coil homology domain-containing protein n=1 Tax=Cryomyces minteri TaxID=331657 RepID=A0A4U0X252_9PEZI|nr:hypothetical protein B0A49_04553 [Cryomyces minteri]